MFELGKCVDQVNFFNTWTYKKFIRTAMCLVAYQLLEFVHDAPACDRRCQGDEATTSELPPTQLYYYV
jgi:hypothetical protein